MKLLTKELRAKFPPLYTNENKDPKDVPVVAKFFTPWSNWSWFATEGCAIIDEGGNDVYKELRFVRESRDSEIQGMVSQSARPHFLFEVSEQMDCESPTELVGSERKKERQLERRDDEELGLSVYEDRRQIQEEGDSGHGTNDRSEVTQGRDCSPQKRGQNGRPTGQLGIDDSIPTHEASLPATLAPCRKVYPVKDILFFGYVIGREAEYGYFSLSELESVKGPGGCPAVERDICFKGTLADAVREGEPRR